VKEEQFFYIILFYCHSRGFFMVLSEINVYPIKSTKGIPLQTAFVERRGIQYDRRWMVVDDSGIFLSQRDYPRLALVSITIKNDALAVSAFGMPPLDIPMKPSSKTAIKVQVHDDVTEGISAGEEARKWFSDYLGVSCRVVFMSDDILRPVNPDYGDEGDIVSFADAFPLLLISEPTLDDLNSRLAVSVPMNRFRPNIVIKGCKAYDEDSWKKIRVGEMIFDVVKPCARCITPTIDQATGIQGKEPLATLSKYRNAGGKVLFGQNIIPENKGTLRVGDAVEILVRKEAAFPAGSMQH
jgi:uncharacterized protein YcbX